MTAKTIKNDEFAAPAAPRKAAAPQFPETAAPLAAAVAAEVDCETPLRKLGRKAKIIPRYPAVLTTFTNESGENVRGYVFDTKKFEGDDEDDEGNELPAYTVHSVQLWDCVGTRMIIMKPHGPWTESASQKIENHQQLDREKPGATVSISGFHRVSQRTATPFRLEQRRTRSPRRGGRPLSRTALRCLRFWWMVA